PIGRDRPGENLFAEIGGHAHAEHPTLTPWQEVRRLTAIRRARRERVVRARRNRELLLPIAVEVAEDQVEAVVRVANPSLEIGYDVLPRREFRLRDRSRQLLRGHEGDTGHDDQRSRLRA